MYHMFQGPNFKHFQHLKETKDENLMLKIWRGPDLLAI